jgi:hypothetical protein
MNREELKAYLDAQVQEIQKYKWLASERERCDIGFERAALEWISLYSDSFRHYWFGEELLPARALNHDTPHCVTQ